MSSPRQGQVLRFLDRLIERWLGDCSIRRIKKSRPHLGGISDDTRTIRREASPTMKKRRIMEGLREAEECLFESQVEVWSSEKTGSKRLGIWFVSWRTVELSTYCILSSVWGKPTTDGVFRARQEFVFAKSVTFEACTLLLAASHVIILLANANRLISPTKTKSHSDSY